MTEFVIGAGPGRKHLINLLMEYQSHWPAESATVQRFVDFVKSHPGCFERGLKIGHVTGSAWLVNKAGTHVLLTHHGKLNRWFQLGGHADGNPDILDVAMREAREESGLHEIVPADSNIFDVDIHVIPERKSDPEHFHYDIRFVLQAVGHEAYTVGDESHDLAWVEIAKLDQVTREESMLRMAEKWKRRSVTN